MNPTDNSAKPSRRARLSILVVFGLAALISGCATEPNVYTGKSGAYAYTWQQERQLGAESDGGIVQQMGLYPDDALAEYVRSIGNTLLAQSAMMQPDAPEMYRSTEFAFRVLDSPVVNAFALPGGFVYVTRGLLAHVNNEAQLAVVIGHEITHVEARHASKQALKQQWGSIGLMAGSILGQSVLENEQLASSILDLSGQVFQLATLKYGRDAERESDLHGVEYAAKSGYDASQGSAFFRSLKRISEKSGQSIPAWQSSHPDPGEREKTIRELFEEWRSGVPDPVVGAERYLERVNGLVVGENPRNGFAREGVFYHPDLNIQFALPPAWQLSNQPEVVQIAEPNGVALLAFTIAKEASPLAAAEALIARAGLTLQTSSDLQIGGMPALQFSGYIPTSSGQLPVSGTYVQHGAKVYAFLGYSRADVFAAARPVMEQVAGSLQEIANPAMRDIQPTRIEVIAAPRAAPFRELLPQSLAPGTDAQDWAIMNQVELDETIPAGARLKLPGSGR